MAKLGALASRLSLIIKAVAPVRLANAVPSRSYSQFPSHWIKPTFKEEAQDALRESGEDQRIAHIPIRPALSADTSSEFHDDVVKKFINFIMRKGKKSVAREELEGAFEHIKRTQLQRYHKAKPEFRESIILDPVQILHDAVINATPVMELIKMKRGGVTYQVPVPILEKRQRFLGMNWIIRAAKEKPRTTPFRLSLANELLDAAYNQGRVVRQKQDLHKQCEANRAYAHYRWA